MQYFTAYPAAVGVGNRAMQIEVECYSGFKGEERPVRLRWEERTLEVQAILRQWYEPGGAYFRIRADDGQSYTLWRNVEGEWSLREQPGG